MALPGRGRNNVYLIPILITCIILVKNKNSEKRTTAPAVVNAASLHASPTPGSAGSITLSCKIIYYIMKKIQ